MWRLYRRVDAGPAAGKTTSICRKPHHDRLQGSRFRIASFWSGVGNVSNFHHRGRTCCWGIPSGRPPSRGWAPSARAGTRSVWRKKMTQSASCLRWYRSCLCYHGWQVRCQCTKSYRAYGDCRTYRLWNWHKRRSREELIVSLTGVGGGGRSRDVSGKKEVDFPFFIDIELCSQFLG